MGAPAETCESGRVVAGEETVVVMVSIVLAVR